MEPIVCEHMVEGPVLVLAFLPSSVEAQPPVAVYVVKGGQLTYAPVHELTVLNQAPNWPALDDWYPKFFKDVA